MILPCALSFVAGGLVGVIAAPAICQQNGWESVHVQHVVALTCGLLGMGASKSVVQAAENDGFKVMLHGFTRMVRWVFGSPDREVRKPDSDVRKV